MRKDRENSKGMIAVMCLYGDPLEVFKDYDNFYFSNSQNFDFNMN